MGKIQVEVCYQDGELKSILVDTRPMRIPSMIKTAPVAAWFEPASTDRVSWDGVGTEIRDKSNSGDENVEYSFLFQGPEKEKQEFLDKVEEYQLGSAATQENMAESAQNYKESAQNASRLGNETLAFNLWRTAAETITYRHFSM